MQADSFFRSMCGTVSSNDCGTWDDLGCVGCYESTWPPVGVSRLSTVVVRSHGGAKYKIASKLPFFWGGDARKVSAQFFGIKHLSHHPRYSLSGISAIS